MMNANFLHFSSIFHQKSCLKKIQLLSFTNYIMIKENYTPTVTGRTALFQERQFTGLSQGNRSKHGSKNV